MLKWLFNRGKNKTKKQDLLPAEPIDDGFQPKQGTFFQTLEYPVTGEDNKTVTGKTWMEAGLNPETGKWVLWVKTVQELDDVLRDKKEFIRNNKVLFEATSFINAYKQMTTFTESMDSLGTKSLENKTIAKLGGDFFKQFAWRENLMMSRSGRLYPLNDDLLAADNFFNEQDLVDAKNFMERHNKEKFIAVPIVLPSTDWSKAYQENKTLTDQRLRALHHRYGNNVNDFAMAKQIIANETPEVLYAYLKGDVLGENFNPKIFEQKTAEHFALVKAAIDRSSVEPISLLSETGLSFTVRHNQETPVEIAIKQKQYSHLHIMLSRDGLKLANFADSTGVSPAIQATCLKDNQAFRMIYLEGIDYSQADENGWYLIHHAFKNDFARGIYAWVDEGLPIDYPIDNTAFTGVSIAKKDNNFLLLDFAQKLGAEMSVEALTEDNETTSSDTDLKEDFNDTNEQNTKIPEFSLALLDSDVSNEIIKTSAQSFVDNGGDINALNEENEHVLEICWKNHKTNNTDINRRSLIQFFGELGADPSETLSDGTTVLTREAKGHNLDLDFIQKIAPYARDINNTNGNGENIMHCIQLNANDQIGHSKNIKAILKLFPELDLNKQNNDGYSNIGLAIRLNRSNTLKEFIKALVVNDSIADFSQTTNGGWSYLDIAFTSAFNQEKGKDFPYWANKIDKISDRLRQNVLGMVNRVMADGESSHQQTLQNILNRKRPDGKSLGQVMTEEQVSEQLIRGLSAWGMQIHKKPQGPGVKPG